MKDLFTLLIGSALVNNVVLTKACGLTNEINSANNKKILNDGIYTGIVMLISAIICWGLQLLLIDKFSLGYFKTLVFVLVNVAVAYLFKGILKKNSAEFALASLNSAILMVCLTNGSYTFAEMLAVSLGSAVGLVVAMYLYAGAVHKINDNHILKSFRGWPIHILAMAIVTLAVFAFK